MPKVKIPSYIAAAARIVLDWIDDLQNEYDRDLTGDLSEYYDAIQPIADEDELEFYTRDGVE